MTSQPPRARVGVSGGRGSSPRGPADDVTARRGASRPRPRRGSSAAVPAVVLVVVVVVLRSKIARGGPRLLRRACSERGTEGRQSVASPWLRLFPPPCQRRPGPRIPFMCRVSMTSQKPGDGAAAGGVPAGGWFIGCRSGCRNFYVVISCCSGSVIAFNFGFR